MIVNIKKKKWNVFALDVESHNDDESIEKNETSIWLGCLLNENSKVDEESSYFYTIDEALQRLDELSNGKRKSGKESRPIKNVLVYIFNLSFEWSFFLPVMVEKGFKFKEVFNDEDEFVFNSITTKSVSSVWEVNMKFHKNSGIVRFRDLSKIFSGSLKSVAKAFNLETQKGEIDYKLNRLHNYQVTKEEKEYCFKDTRIIVEILEKMKEDKVFWNSCSMASYSMMKMLRTSYPDARKPYLAFRNDYPVLDAEEDEFIRKGTSGGITYPTPRYQFKVIEEPILHIDAHQMHPYQMATHYFPYGKGTFKKGKPVPQVRKLQMCHIMVSYSSVKIHSVIKLIGLPFIEEFELYVWNFEIPTMYKCYEDLKIEYIDYYEYDARPLPFRKYIMDNYRKRLQAKEEGNAFFVLLYKLLNNSAYGKFLERPHNVVFANTIGYDGIITCDVIEKEELELVAKYTYTPIGSSIPAYSRVYLCETALKFDWKDIVYFDTDSIFVIWNENTERVWNTEINRSNWLGGWGLEEMISKSQFTAPKRYKAIDESTGEAYFKIAGVNLKSKIQEKAKDLNIKEEKVRFSFEEVNITCEDYFVQRAYRCKGGTLIKMQKKSVDVQAKYKSIYELNTNE